MLADTSRLKEFIRSNGWTEREFCSIYKGVSQPYLNQILNGKRKAGEKTCLQLAKIVGDRRLKRELRPDLWG